MTEEHYSEPAEVQPVTTALDLELKRFQQRFRELTGELADKQYPMDDNDLTLFRESLLALPADDQASELRAVRQSALDDPEKLRELFQVTLRTREAIDRISREGSG